MNKQKFDQVKVLYNMRGFLKKSTVFGICLMAFLLAMSSFFLLAYLFFFQSGEIISRSRLLSAAAVGIVFGASVFVLAFRSLRAKKLSGISLAKFLLLSTILSGIFYLMVPVPANYLLAPQGQFDITVHLTDAKSDGSTKITLLNNGLDYIPFRSVQYEPGISNLLKGQSPTLVFDPTGEAHFSWQGRSWKFIQIDLHSAQAAQLTLKSGGTISVYAIIPGKDVSLKIPVRGQIYYSLIEWLVVLATIIMLWIVLVLLSLSKPEKINVFLDSKLRWLPGEKWVNGLTAVIFSVLVLFVIFIGFQNRVYSDDYCSIVDLHNAGYLKSMVNLYENNTGRFSAHIVSFAFFELPALNTVIGPLFAVLFMGGSLYFLFMQLLGYYKRDLRIKLSALFSITLVGTFFLSTPYLYESFFWNQQNISIAGGLAFFNVAVALVLRNLRAKDNPRSLILWSIFFFVWGVFGAGFNEVIGMYNILLFGVILLVLLIKKPVEHLKPALTRVIAYLAGSIIGLIVCVVAPGNTQRVNQLGFSTRIPLITAAYLNLVRSSVGDIFSKNRYLPLFLIFFVLVGAYYWGKSLPSFLPWTRQPFIFFEKVLLIIAPFLIFLIAFAPSAFVASYFPERTMAIPITYAVTVAFVSAFTFGNTHRLSNNSLLRLVLPIAFIVLGIFSFSYLLGFSNQMKLFGAEWDARERQIEMAVAAGEKGVTVSPYKYIPGTDLSTTENLWLNQCENKFYGIQLNVKEN